MSLPKLLLLHGALGAASQFDSLKSTLENDFEIFTINFPGHGGSELPQNFSFPVFVSSIINFLDENNIRSVDVFGYSMGGYAALMIAKQYPDRVHKIFTLATKMEWNETTSAREASMLNPEKMEEKIPAFAKMLEERHAPQDWKQVVRRTAAMMTDLGTNHLSENDFRSIEQPVMISVGDKDNMVTMDESRRVAEWLQHGSLHIFPGMYHPFEKVETDKLALQLKEYFL